jgi:hypothetical protein
MIYIVYYSHITGYTEPVIASIQVKISSTSKTCDKSYTGRYDGDDISITWEAFVRGHYTAKKADF